DLPRAGRRSRPGPGLRRHRPRQRARRPAARPRADGGRHPLAAAARPREPFPQHEQLRGERRAGPLPAALRARGDVLRARAAPRRTKPARACRGRRSGHRHLPVGDRAL
ncbi:MAG: hypothetical protein AVDCRST_MAG45-1112, partial [uncultured Solirubrobacterales bacterium]